MLPSPEGKRKSCSILLQRFLRSFSRTSLLENQTGVIAGNMFYANLRGLFTYSNYFACLYFLLIKLCAALSSSNNYALFVLKYQHLFAKKHVEINLYLLAFVIIVVWT